MGKSPLPWIIAGGAVLVYAAFQGTAKALSGKNLNLKITNLDFQSKPPVVEITMINPYQGFLELQNITGDIIFNGNSIGTLYFNKLTALPPNKVISIRVPVRFNPIDAAGIIVDLINKPKTEWRKYFANGKLEIAGTLSAENILLPYSSKFSF
jgi:LEA14-like dessication related protein